jgi:hypothetical protein
MVGKYGVVVKDVSQYQGFRNYQKKDVMDAIEMVIVYLKLKKNIYHFEHNDYESKDYCLDGIEGEPEFAGLVKMDWVVIHFGGVSYPKNELVIAIDVFENGTSKLRIHSPDNYISEFDDNYKDFDGKLEPGYFMTTKEENFINCINNIFKII